MPALRGNLLGEQKSGDLLKTSVGRKTFQSRSSLVSHLRFLLGSEDGWPDDLWEYIFSFEKDNDLSLPYDGLPTTSFLTQYLRHPTLAIGGAYAR